MGPSHRRGAAGAPLPRGPIGLARSPRSPAFPAGHPSPAGAADPPAHLVRAAGVRRLRTQLGTPGRRGLAGPRAAGAGAVPCLARRAGGSVGRASRRARSGARVGAAPEQPAGPHPSAPRCGAHGAGRARSPQPGAHPVPPRAGALPSTMRRRPTLGPSRPSSTPSPGPPRPRARPPPRGRSSPPCGSLGATATSRRWSRRSRPRRPSTGPTRLPSWSISTTT